MWPNPIGRSQGKRVPSNILRKDPLTTPLPEQQQSREVNSKCHRTESRHRKSVRRIHNKNGYAPQDLRNNASGHGPSLPVSRGPNQPRHPNSYKSSRAKSTAYAFSRAEIPPLPSGDLFSASITRRLLRAVWSAEFHWRQSAAQVQEKASREKQTAIDDNDIKNNSKETECGGQNSELRIQELQNVN